MSENPKSVGRGIDRRSFLAGALAATVVGGTAAGALAQEGQAAGADVIETVTGPINMGDVKWALAHEHLHGDFTGSTPPLWKSVPEGYVIPAYADTDWSAVAGAAVNALNEVKAYGVDLVVDYTPPGVGRNVRMLREVSRKTGISVVAASGLYQTAWGIPPELADFDSDQLATHFTRELTLGAEGTGIRAGFMKLSVGNSGPLPHDEIVYRGGARASVQTGSTIGVHAIVPSSFKAVFNILDEEGMNLDRLIWAHAGRDGTVDFDVFREYAERGVYISFDGTTHNSKPTDDQLLGLVEQFIEAGLEHKVLISSDATIAANPPIAQYASDIRYPYRIFKPKLEERFGADLTRLIFRDNVVAAYRRGANVA